MFSPLAMLPASWRTSVVVLRGGGRDAKGNPLPVQEIAVDDCLMAARATAEPVDRSEAVDSRAVLYHAPEDGLVFLAADRIRVPDGARMAGTWTVDGRPGEWPFGWEVGLERA